MDINVADKVKLSVQPAQPEDRAAIYDILTTSGLFDKTDADCVDEMFTGTWKALEADPRVDTYRWLTCKFEFELDGHYNSNSNCAGFACFGTESLTHNTWDLYWVCVRPAARGKGVARALMQAVIAQSQAQGARLMVIYTSSTAPYAPARALYESQGFVCTAVVPEYYNVGDDLNIYSRKLC